MSKRSKKPLLQSESASNSPSLHPDATLSPDATLESTNIALRDRDSTNATASDSIEPPGRYAEATAGLVHRFLTNDLFIPRGTVLIVLAMLWIGFIAWLFQQDNAAGLLASWEGMKWFAAKVAYFSIFFVVASAIVVGTYHLSKRTKK